MQRGAPLTLPLMPGGRPAPGLALALLMALSLALTGMLWAQAQARPAGITHLTLCSEAGSTEILVDARGNPAPPPLPCPDCLAALVLAPPPAAPAAATRRRPQRGRPCQGARLPGRRNRTPRARDPPRHG